MGAKLLTAEDVKAGLVSLSRGSFCLPRHTILGHADITRVLRHKERATWWGEYFKVIYLCGQNATRMGCALTRKKLKSSVHRHKVYRIWKEFIRHHKTSFHSMHFVILLKEKILTFEPVQVWRDIHNFERFVLALSTLTNSPIH